MGVRTFACVLAGVCALGVVTAEADARTKMKRANVKLELPKSKPKPQPKFPESEVTLDEVGRAPGLVAYPPKTREKAQPVTVFLHGMCDEPENECPWIAGAATESGWLLCPRAPLRCSGGGSIWPIDDRFPKSVEGSVSRLQTDYPGTVDPDAKRTLVGFSLGAIRAADLVQRKGNGFSSAIFIGAKFELDAERLRKAGVKRVLLAAGDHDMMKWRMVDQAKKLRRGGFPVAFVSLGKVGHWFPSDMRQKMETALDWVHGNDDAFEPERLGELEFVPGEG
jgi:predicted esterase